MCRVGEGCISMGVGVKGRIKRVIFVPINVL